MSETILITGASSGFGRITAEVMAQAGHMVFASMRDPSVKNRNHAQELRQRGIAVLELDIGSDTSVDHAVKKVLADVGRIDVLINNAGIASAGITEAFTADQAKVVLNTTLAWSAVNASVIPAEAIPALFISTSMRPASASTSLTAWSTEASLLISSSTTAMPCWRNSGP